MSDTDTISSSKDDLWGMLSSLISATNLKLMLALFLIFIFITSNVFTTRVLRGFSGTYDRNEITNYGVVLQGIFLVLAYMMMEGAITVGLL